jgi:hypothetical protein
MMGALQCEGYIGDANIHVKTDVGSGFDDSLRADIFNHQEQYLGAMIEVQYYEVSYGSKKPLPSLRLPSFKRFRRDK